MVVRAPGALFSIPDKALFVVGVVLGFEIIIVAIVVVVQFSVFF
jgi:hypothetical protein